MSQSAMLSRAREPDWCVAARGVGTYISRVLMPRPTCRGGRRGESCCGCSAGTASAQSMTWKRKGPGLQPDFPPSNSLHAVQYLHASHSQ